MAQRAEMEICAVSSTDVSTRTSGADAPPINVPLDDDDAPAAIEEARQRCSPTNPNRNPARPYPPYPTLTLA